MRDLVRRGYDAVSYRYRADDAGDGEYGPWLEDLQRRVPAGGAVLDLGCGCGVPVSRFLVHAGYRVTGIDISDVQVERARCLVPGATFIRADATGLDFPPASFDAIACLYALIHMPLRAQPTLVRRMAAWLRPGGWLLATVGRTAWTGTEDGWLGGPATMWWSQADSVTYRAWFEQAGLTVASEQFVPEGAGGHTLFWLLAPSKSDGPPGLT